MVAAGLPTSVTTTVAETGYPDRPDRPRKPKKRLRETIASIETGAHLMV